MDRFERRSLTRLGWWLLPPALLVASAWLQVVHGVYFSMFTHDLFVPVEGVVHLQHGEWPHRDFGSPLGVLYYILHYLPTLVAPLSTSTLVYANLLTALAVALGTMLFARGRVPMWLGSLTALYLGLTASSPRQIGEQIAAISNNAAYNRFGWAIIGLLALIVACPRMDQDNDTARRSSLIDGLAVGTLLSALFFIKMTYAVAAVGIIAAALVLVRRPADWRFPAGTLAPFAIIVLLVEVTTGLVHLYLGDLGATTAVVEDVLRPTFAVRLLVYCLSGAAAVLVVGLMLEWDRRRLVVWVPRTLLALAVIAAGVAIGIQNHPELENPLLPVAALIAGFPALRRRSDDTADGTSAPRLARTGCIVAFLSLATPPVVLDLAGVGWTAMAPRASGDNVAWLADTRLSDLRLPAAYDRVPGTERNPLRNDGDLMGIIGDGTGLLRRHIGERRDVRVLPLTFSNPYPSLLGLPPVTNELAWWHFGRTFSLRIRPDPARLLRGVDYVLIPKRYSGYFTVMAMRRVYDPVIERDFRQVDESQDWQLFARRDCQVRVLC